MPQPTEHKSIQAHIRKYAEEIGWRFVSRSKDEQQEDFFNRELKFSKTVHS